MGRSKRTPEERNTIVAAFVQATRKTINDEGVDAASIRLASAQTGYSSATLYLYFKNVNALIALSSISYLEGYCHKLVNAKLENTSALDTYIRTWRHFCNYTLAHPRVFLHLFYGQHAF